MRNAPVYLSLVTLWTCCAAPLATAMPASDEHQQLTLILRQPDVTDRHSSTAASYLVDPIPLPTSYPHWNHLHEANHPVPSDCHQMGEQAHLICGI